MLREACEGCLLYLLQLCLHAEYVTCKSRGLDDQSVNELETKTAWILRTGMVSYLRFQPQAEKTGEPLEDTTKQGLNCDRGCPTFSCEQDPDMDELLQIEMLELEPWGGIFQIELKMSNVRDTLKEAF